MPNNNVTRSAPTLEDMRAGMPPIDAEIDRMFDALRAAIDIHLDGRLADDDLWQRIRTTLTMATAPADHVKVTTKACLLFDAALRTVFDAPQDIQANFFGILNFIVSNHRLPAGMTISFDPPEDERPPVRQ